MPRIGDTTNEQSKFLRAFARNPAGPPAAEWPSAAVLRRWLRKPAFRDRFDELRRAARFQADVHFDAVTLRAAADLSDAAHRGDRVAMDADLDLFRAIQRGRR